MGQSKKRCPPGRMQTRGHAALAAGRGEDWSRIPARGTTIDSLVADLSLESVALIKIDVEGVEPAVIREASNVLKTHGPALVFEYLRSYWPEFAESLGPVGQHLSDHGYERLFSISRRGVERLSGDPSDSDLVALLGRGRPSREA
jgi:hypothetical protein